MAVSLTGCSKGSLVHRFITSGKPGYCELCKKPVEKLEAHHIKYEPEITIKICHDCHHKAHFWPLRLSVPEKKKILLKVYPEQTAEHLSKFKFSDVSDLARIVAPSRQAFIHAAQKLEEKETKQASQKPAKKLKKISDVHKAIQELPRLKEKKKDI